MRPPRPRRIRQASKQRRASVPPHAFAPQAGEPADYSGRQVCAACAKPGRYGDTQHPDGALPLADVIRPPAPPYAQELAARILGERDGD